MKEVIKYLMNLYGYLFHHNRESKVLYYHDVSKAYTDMGTPLEIIKAHLDVIQKCNFNIVKQISEKTNQIMICFDDGWKGIYDNKEFFLKNKIYPTIFIAVDLIGAEGYMDASQIKELHKSGFEFEGHTWTHTGLPEHHGDDLRHEIIDSKKKIEDTVGFEIHDICFPQGRYSDEAINMSHDAGYRYLYSSANGGYYTLENKGLICRNLLQYVPANQIKFIIEGDSPLYRRKLIKMQYK